MVTALLARGTLALATAGAGHRHEPRWIRLAQDEAQSLTPGPRRRAEHPQPSRWALPPRPAQGPLWLVVCASGTVALVTREQDELATTMLAEPGRRLFREVRTRLRVEFED